MVATVSPRAMRWIQRARLWAMTCTASQAPLAAKRPEGRWFRPTPHLRSRMAFSTSAWRRWSASSCLTSTIPAGSVASRENVTEIQRVISVPTGLGSGVRRRGIRSATHIAKPFESINDQRHDADSTEVQISESGKQVSAMCTEDAQIDDDYNVARFHVL